MAPLGKCLACLHLDALLTLPDIKEAREGAIYVRVYVFPCFNVKDWIAFTYFSDQDPIFELTDFFIQPVSILWHRRHRFVSDWAHVVIVAVIDVGLILGPQACLQILKCSRRVNSQSLALPMQLVAYSTLTSDAKVAIEKTEPKDERIVTRERSKRDALVRRFEAENFESLLRRNWSLGTNSER